jgi:ADP-ribose pyrophosphatase
MPHEEKMLESREIFNGQVIRVTQDKVLLENGKTSMREVVHHHGGACVLAVTEGQEIYMVRQFRYALGEEIWELPAGKLEAGEQPFLAAKRELTEECGITADHYYPLGTLYATVGYDNEKIYIWAAKGLHEAQQHLDADEFLDVHKVPLEQAVQMVMDDTIRDSKSISGILKYAALHEKGEF